MRYRLFGLFVLFLAGCAPDPVTVCIFPDTQALAPGVFAAQVEDCAARAPAYAVHLGDVAFTLDSPEKWTEVGTMLPYSGIPFSVALGNHDFNHFWHTAQFFLSWFDHASYPWIREVSPWVGDGLIEGGADLNYYAFFPQSNPAYLELTLEWNTGAAELPAWVDYVLTKHPRTPAVVTMHTNLSTLASTIAETVIPEGMTNCGPESDLVWESFLRTHPNVFLVVNGHAGVVINEPDCATVRTNDAGLPVAEMLVNYQHRPPAQGCYRILTISEALGGSIRAQTYCVGTGEYELDANSDYTIGGMQIGRRRSLP